MNTILNKKTKFLDLGLVDYKQAWDYQTTLFQAILDVKAANRTSNLQPPDSLQETNNYLLFCEHPHVYTLGKSGDEKTFWLTKKIFTPWMPLTTTSTAEAILPIMARGKL